MENSVFLVGGYHLDTDVSSDKVFELDLRTEKWIEVCAIPGTCTVNYEAALSHGGLYIFGGHDSISGESSTSIDRFDVMKKTWAERASLPTPMFLNSVVFAEEDSSFYISGDPTWMRTDSGQCYETETSHRPSADSKLWRTSTDTRKLEEILMERPGFLTETPITLNGSGISVFSCGGFDEIGAASGSSFPYYSPFLAACSTPINISSLLVPRGSHGLLTCAANSSVYALGGIWRMGGRRSFRSCEVYDTHRDQWFFAPKMKQPRRNFSVTNLGNQLMAFGGFDGEKGVSFDSELHDVRTGMWRKGPDVPGLLWNYGIA